MEYRREIDGLRAIAVLPVIFFHAGFQTFSGGFVGVDVFFVISGYLITAVILFELEQDKFSIATFFERRVRRILPALFFVMFMCLPFAWFWLTPMDWTVFSRSLIAVSVFASNFLFWIESGYFDTGAELKPLLHTWSLAVEEQYYVLFPIFLMITWRLGKGWVVGFLLILFIISLGLAQWGSSSKPVATFYLLPTRGWELLVGAFVAFYLSRNYKNIFSDGVSELGGNLGFILILFSIFAFNKKIPSPSLYTLIPTIGTALVLIFATKNTIIGKFLGNRLFVSIGLISYSAYLWHQPILALLRHRSLDNNLSFELLCVAIMVIFLLAYLTWKYVENPFRNKNVFNRKNVFTVAVVGSVFFVVFGFYGAINSIFIKNETIYSSQIELKKKVMLLGDSHAGHLAPRLQGLTKIFGVNIVRRSFGGCIPFYNVDRYDSRLSPGVCPKNINRELAAFESEDDYGLVILSSMGPVYLDNKTFKEKDIARITGSVVELVDDKSVQDRWIVFEIGMRRTLQKLSSLDGKKIIFVLDVPELGIEPKVCGAPKGSVFLLGTRFGIGENSYDNCRITRSDFEVRTDRYHKLVKRILLDFPNVMLFDPTPLFCDSEWCYGHINGEKLYEDVDHLSDFGANYVAKRLAPLIVDMMK